MGNYFDKQQVGQNYDQTFIHFIRTQKDMDDVLDVVEYIREYFPTTYKFNFVQFKEIFHQYFEQHTEFIFQRLENNQNMDGMVDVFETIALMCLVNRDDFEKRLDYIFRLFDFDFSDNLEIHEFILTIGTAMKGLCKVVDMIPPSDYNLEQFADQFFKNADVNNDGMVSMKEFVEFVKKNWELQDWFLKFAGIQTYENAQRRCDQRREYLNSQFLGYKNIKETDDYVKIKSNIDIFFPILQKQLKNLSEQDFQILKKYIIDVSNSLNTKQEQGYINYQGYNSVINAWSAFDGSDINNDNSIDKTEIEFLIGSMENYKPWQERIQKELKDIDIDKSGQISREEWISYTCLNESSSAKSFFRTNIRRHFLNESRNSETIKKNQLQSIIKQNIKDFLNRYKYKKGLDIENETKQSLVDQMTNQIYARCREEYINDQFVITWQGFQNTLEFIFQHDNELVDFVDKFK